MCVSQLPCEWLQEDRVRGSSPPFKQPFRHSCSLTAINRCLPTSLESDSLMLRSVDLPRAGGTDPAFAALWSAPWQLQLKPLASWWARHSLKQGGGQGPFARLSIAGDALFQVPKHRLREQIVIVRDDRTRALRNHGSFFHRTRTPCDGAAQVGAGARCKQHAWAVLEAVCISC